MRLNEHTALSTSKILLVPYCKHHVPTYHAWMQDPGLQAATASEPLTLEEEYAMQRSWRTDADKLTFIICAAAGAGLARDDDDDDGDGVGGEDGEESMIGDVNLFLFAREEDEEEEGGESMVRNGCDVVGEIELMVARKEMRRRGYGRAALLAFLDYIVTNWTGLGQEYSRAADDGDVSVVGGGGGAEVHAPRLSFLRVKIQESNVASITLFESIGFIRTSESANYFGEVELHWRPDGETLRQLEAWEEVEVLRYSYEKQLKIT